MIPFPAQRYEKKKNKEERMKNYSPYSLFFLLFTFHISLFCCTFAPQKEKEVNKKIILVSICLLLTLIVVACKSAHYCNCG